MVKNKVYIVRTIAEDDPILAGNKCKPFAQFQKELLQVINEAFFRVRIRLGGMVRVFFLILKCTVHE